MKTIISPLIRLVFITILLAGSFTVQSDGKWYGGEEDVGFAKELWMQLLKDRLVGSDALPDEPYIGTHPHGAILETTINTVSVKGIEGMVVTKRSYRGRGVSVSSVSANRKKFLDEVTVMFKRESGYDTPNKDWFWAKYTPDGKLASTPNGVQLAGRIAKGKSKSCIACHRKAEGDDFLFVN